MRRFSETICEPLSPEDCVIQSMADVSPTRWHLAHTTWFFETFALAEFARVHEPYDSAFEVLFNSYYNTVGEQFPRSRRGLLSRPTVAEVLEYRRETDDRMCRLLAEEGGARRDELLRVVELGLHHEQQHQELMLTDIKHVLSCNPLFPVYRRRDMRVVRESTVAPLVGWRRFDESLRSIGHDGNGFAFDNELPRHRVLLPAFQLADRLVTNGEYLAFIEDGGYRRPELWLSLGWAQVQAEGWHAPFYWHANDGEWSEFTLAGLAPLDPAAPVCHVSYFEADAFARWADARLPTEAEWETVAGDAATAGSFVESQALHPLPASAAAERELKQMYGDVWQWTASPYVAYPGYRPAAGALGEYNAKFMCNQFVLRGGSCATARGHMRRTYRNFFPPQARWQFSGFRLARDDS